MKVEINRVSAFLFVVMVPINFITLLMGGLNGPGYLALFSLAMFYLMIAVPMVGTWIAEERAILRIGNMVEWDDTEGVARKGKLLGQVNGNWLIDWTEPKMSVGALPPNELRKVRK